MTTPQTICHIDLQPQGLIKTLKFLSHHLRHATKLFPNRNQNHIKPILWFLLRVWEKRWGSHKPSVEFWVQLSYPLKLSPRSNQSHYGTWHSNKNPPSHFGDSTGELNIALSNKKGMNLKICHPSQEVYLGAPSP